ncbi:hypothetical protein QQJ67_16915 [Proteus mirabilis]|nr:hypothetical protein [Proteus mirabilis]MDL2140686.1 hypothetical protein [Proteus mirabilis]
MGRLQGGLFLVNVSLSATKLPIDDIFAMLVALGKLKPEPLNF